MSAAFTSKSVTVRVTWWKRSSSGSSRRPRGSPSRRLRLPRRRRALPARAARRRRRGAARRHAPRRSERAHLVRERGPTGPWSWHRDFGFRRYEPSSGTNKRDFAGFHIFLLLPLHAAARAARARQARRLQYARLAASHIPRPCPRELGVLEGGGR